MAVAGVAAAVPAAAAGAGVERAHRGGHPRRHHQWRHDRRVAVPPAAASAAAGPPRPRERRVVRTERWRPEEEAALRAALLAKGWGRWMVKARSLAGRTWKAVANKALCLT